MASKTTGAGWWLVGGAVLAVAGLAWWGSQSDRKARARAVRRQADQELLRRLEELSRNGEIPEFKRGLGAAGAIAVRLWIDSGMSGVAMPEDIKLKVYGNWCGPGVGSGFCVDEIDCLCRDHDQQYAHAEALEAGRALRRAVRLRRIEALSSVAGGRVVGTPAAAASAGETLSEERHDPLTRREALLAQHAL